jgi:hypothetical protein
MAAVKMSLVDADTRGNSLSPKIHDVVVKSSIFLLICHAVERQITRLVKHL